MIFTLVFFLAALIQIAFLVIFLAAFRKSRTGVSGAASPAQPSVSVVVCAHDEAENLEALIPLLAGQRYPVFEVVVVDDRSSDGTYDYLLNAARQFPNLKIVRVTSKPVHVSGKKYALTLDIKAAAHEVVLLTDADCRPAGEDWISTMATRFDENTGIVLGYSPYNRKPGLLNAFIRFECLLTGIQYIGAAIFGRPYMGVGRNVAYRRSLFLENKGFKGHQHVVGGDDDLFVNTHATAANTQLALAGHALVFTRPKSSWREFYVQKLRHLSVGRFYKTSDRLWIGLFACSWILHWCCLVPALMTATKPGTYAMMAVFLTRWFFLTSLFNLASRKLGDRFEAWKVPFLDIIYAIYYLVTGLSALQSKRVRWKKI